MEVTNDLKALLNLEMPPRSDKAGRNIVKWTMLFFSILLVSSFGVVTYALVASLQREDDLRTSLTCVRSSSVTYDEAIGDAVKLLVDLDVPISEALVAVGRGDQASLDESLSKTDAVIAAAGPVKTKIDEAIKARTDALTEC